MKVKKVVTSILAMLVAGSVIAGCGGSGGDKKSADGKLDRSKQFVTVLTGPTSGIYFPIGGAFSKVVGEMGYKTSSTAQQVQRLKTSMASSLEKVNLPLLCRTRLFNAKKHSALLKVRKRNRICAL